MIAISKAYSAATDRHGEAPHGPVHEILLTVIALNLTVAIAERAFGIIAPKAFAQDVFRST